MKSSRLWSIFLSLSGNEIREVGKCVRSPFFNNRVAVQRLFDYFSKCKKERLEPTKSEIHQYLFPHKEFKDLRVRNEMTYLLKVIERYITFQELETDKLRTQLALASGFRKRQLEKHYRFVLKEAEGQLENQTRRNADFYESKYLLEFEKYRQLSTKRKLDLINLQELSEYTDIAFLAQKLKQICFSISHQRVYSKEYDYGLLPFLLEAASSEKYLSIPAISIYFHCYYSLTQPEDTSHFKKFKKLLFSSRDAFPSVELGDLYLLATNYCIQRLNKNERQYAGEALEIYKQGLKDEALLTDGVLPHITFSNIVSMCIAVGELDFAEAFLEKYRLHLTPNKQEPIYVFNLARVNYRRGKFEDALPLLMREVYKDLLLSLMVKTLTAKIFFESGESDLLVAHLEAMQQFIRRKKVMGYHRGNFLNFATYLKRIVEIAGFDKTSIDKLKEEIKNIEVVAERKWLLGKLEN